MTRNERHRRSEAHAIGLYLKEARQRMRQAGLDFMQASRDASRYTRQLRLIGMPVPAKPKPKGPA